MQSQLEHVRSALNQLVEPPASSSAAAAAMHTPTKASAGEAAASRPAGGGLEGLLEHISSRLDNIEGLYTNMSSRMVRGLHLCITIDHACITPLHVSPHDPMCQSPPMLLRIQS